MKRKMENDLGPNVEPESGRPKVVVRGPPRRRLWGRTGLSFGRIMRQRRRGLEISLEALAGATGLNKASLSQVETGRLKPPEIYPHVVKIAEILGLQPGSDEYDQFLCLAAEARFQKKRRFLPKLSAGQLRVVTSPAEDSGPPATLPQSEPVETGAATLAIVFLGQVFLEAFRVALSHDVGQIVLRTRDGRELLFVVSGGPASPGSREEA